MARSFAFDPDRRAIVLVAGDKSGWKPEAFYRQLIAKADLRFSRAVESLKPAQRRDLRWQRSLNEIIAELPPEEQEGIEARYQVLKQEVEACASAPDPVKAQEDIASALNIMQRRCPR